MKDSVSVSMNDTLRESLSDSVTTSLPSRAPADQGTGSMEGNREHGALDISPSTPPSPTSTAAGDTVDGVDLLIEAERRIRAEAAEADRTHNRVDEEHRTRFYHRAIGLRQAANLVRTLIDEKRGVLVRPELEQQIAERLAAWVGEAS